MLISSNLVSGCRPRFCLFVCLFVVFVVFVVVVVLFLLLFFLGGGYSGIGMAGVIRIILPFRA